MSEIHRMIDKWCSGAIEYKELGALISIYTGTQFNKRDMLEDGQYPVLNGGIGFSGYTNSYNVEPNTITISQGGASAGFVNWVAQHFWAGAHCFIVKPLSGKLDNRYLYHFLKKMEKNLMSSKQGAGIPGLNRKNVQSLVIPLPPLEIQSKIVEKLDTFMALTDALTAELTARKKQYEYYRESLLAFEDRSDIPWKAVEAICDVRRGIRVVKKQLKETGRYPVFQNSIPPMGFYDQFNREGEMPYIICAGSSSGSIGYCSTPFWAADDCYTVESNQLNSRFLFHVLKLYNQKLFNQVRKGSMPRLAHTAIDSLLIPVPSISEQERIVSVLDRFDVLTASLSEGLPAEIKARQQQYEYYRDHLLNFKRAN